MYKIFFILFLVFALCSCTKKYNQFSDKADALAHRFIIVDGHVDLPYRLKVKNFRFQKEYIGIPIKSKEGDFDYHRAKKGGLSAPFMSVYIPANLDSIESKLLADSLIQMINWIADNNKSYFEVANTPTDIQRIFKAGKIALPMGMENGSPISAIEDVSRYRKMGINYITLTHSKVNKICDSSYDTIRKYNGLSTFGYKVVEAMNNEGVMIDISHVSDSTFFDVIRFTKVPVIASHSSSRKFTPGFERNMGDDLIVALKKNGGVIMVNFGTDFLDGSISKSNKDNNQKVNDLLKEKGIDAHSKQGKAFVEKFKSNHPTLYADVEKVADHIDHIVSLSGIDHVGIGSDFDGVGDSLPKGLKDVSNYPNLIAELLERGYSEQDIEKICYKNLFRVWNKVLDYSEIH
ncbi:MAG: hypothetical protein RLZZ546_2554 [Bacteroidota bacterium]|jgi:membrane dipeptidase